MLWHRVGPWEGGAHRHRAGMADRKACAVDPHLDNAMWTDFPTVSVQISYPTPQERTKPSGGRMTIIVPYSMTGWSSRRRSGHLVSFFPSLPSFLTSSSENTVDASRTEGRPILKWLMKGHSDSSFMRCEI